ncbi:MAG: hypothetical protein JXA60_05355 [Candidatus Coatesbacteria bacterium]|nr:hypothetical protein [Candidatus Coatesbacteria bacterium]
MQEKKSVFPVQATRYLSPVFFLIISFSRLFSWEPSLYNEGFFIGTMPSLDIWLENWKYSSNLNPSQFSTLCEARITNSYSLNAEGGYFFKKKHGILVNLSQLRGNLVELSFNETKRSFALNNINMGYRRYIRFDRKSEIFIDACLGYFYGQSSTKVDLPSLEIQGGSINVSVGYLKRIIDPLFIGGKIGFASSIYNTRAASMIETKKFSDSNHIIRFYPFIEANF